MNAVELGRIVITDFLSFPEQRWIKRETSATNPLLFYLLHDKGHRAIGCIVQGRGILRALDVVEYALRCTRILTSESVL